MKIAAVSGFCIAAAVLCRIFDKTGREYGVMISAAAALMITAVSMTMLSPLVDFILAAFEKTGADEEYVNILFKSAGICYLTSLSSGICGDSGEKTLAQSVNMIGRITLAVTALPVFEDLSEIVTELLK